MLTETRPGRPDIKPKPKEIDPKQIPAIQRKPDGIHHPETLQAIGELFADAVGKGKGWMFE